MKEFFELVLSHLRVLCPLVELTDLVLEWLRQINILHRHIGIVDFFLLSFRLRANLRDQDGKLTEDIGLENGAGQIDHHHEDQLAELLRSHFIASDDKHRVVKTDPVNEEVFTIIIAVPEGIISVVVVIRWYPRLVTAVFLRK